ncbi:MAG: xanthine dehydrogenase family protein subunit M [bacterium]|nr:xanthine dehydrogenase family protein subunit M [Acidimicrobiia bacterium]MCY4650052.1 xanthine dehydrogenase family protein subunit M [bacterium]
MQFLAPMTVDEALGALSEREDGLRVLAGGTDVMIQRMTGQLPRSESLLYIGGITDLSGVHLSDGTICIGALTTHHDLRCNPVIGTDLPSFAEAAATVGGWQTQAVGTIGGNLCNASPAADLAPPLLAADATLVVSGEDGPQRIPANRFFLGRRRTALPVGQILLKIEVPVPPAATWESYLKVGRRSAMEVALVGLAARFSLAGGLVETARLAVCSVAPVPLRLAHAEAALVGSTLDQGAVAIAAQRSMEEIDPIDDQRATASYRRMLVGRLLGKAARLAREGLEIQ